MSALCLWYELAEGLQNLVLSSGMSHPTCNATSTKTAWDDWLAVPYTPLPSVSQGMETEAHMLPGAELEVPSSPLPLSKGTGMIRCLCLVTQFYYIKKRMENIKNVCFNVHFDTLIFRELIYATMCRSSSTLNIWIFHEIPNSLLVHAYCLMIHKLLGLQ